MTDLDGLDSERRIVTQNLTADLDGLVPFLLGVADKLADGHHHDPCYLDRDHRGRWCPKCKQESDADDPSWRCSSVLQAEGIRAMVARWFEVDARARRHGLLPDITAAVALQDALCILAGMHANVPGYRPEWGLG